MKKTGIFDTLQIKIPIIKELVNRFQCNLIDWFVNDESIISEYANMKHGAFKHIIVVAEYFYQCNETFAKPITIEGKNDCDIYFG